MPQDQPAGESPQGNEGADLRAGSWIHGPFTDSRIHDSRFTDSGIVYIYI